MKETQIFDGIGLKHTYNALKELMVNADHQK